jgi:ribA/ribD-fused uncharacterized protein
MNKYRPVLPGWPVVDTRQGPEREPDHLMYKTRYVVTSMSTYKDEFVFFYKPEHDYGYLSQWYYAPFRMDDLVFTTAEMFMMYMKAKIFDDNETMHMILSTPDSGPLYHKKLGRQVKGFDERKWSDVSLDLVAAGNYYKFTQNPELARMLMSTYGKKLVEASPYDRIWGIGYKQEDAMKNISMWGDNRLGVALMMVREKIKEKLDTKRTTESTKLIDV